MSLNLVPTSAFSSRGTVSAIDPGPVPAVAGVETAPAIGACEVVVFAQEVAASLGESPRLLLPAGAETTFRVMGNCLVALLSHPGVYEQVVADRVAGSPHTLATKDRAIGQHQRGRGPTRRGVNRAGGLRRGHDEFVRSCNPPGPAREGDLRTARVCNQAVA